jgi:hypothetical protein
MLSSLFLTIYAILMSISLNLYSIPDDSFIALLSYSLLLPAINDYVWCKVAVDRLWIDELVKYLGVFSCSLRDDCCMRS